jgi:VWFA-related protein
VGNVIASLTPADRIQVISFATAIREMRADAATSVIGRLGGGLVAGRTALQDAVMLSLMQPTPPDRRRAIVVLTDGVDSSSVTEYGIRREILDRSDTVVYVIACGSRDFRTRPQEGSPNEDRILAVTATGGAWTVPYGGYDWILEDVAERTGGRFSTSQSSGDFAQSLRDALDELRSRYVVTFRPSGVDRPGWHELKVTVPTRPKAEVRARKGYFGG